MEPKTHLLLNTRSTAGQPSSQQTDVTGTYRPHLVRLSPDPPTSLNHIEIRVRASHLSKGLNLSPLTTCSVSQTPEDEAAAFSPHPSPSVSSPGNTWQGQNTPKSGKAAYWAHQIQMGAHILTALPSSWASAASQAHTGALHPPHHVLSAWAPHLICHKLLCRSAWSSGCVGKLHFLF